MQQGSREARIGKRPLGVSAESPGCRPALRIPWACGLRSAGHDRTNRDLTRPIPLRAAAGLPRRYGQRARPRATRIRLHGRALQALPQATPDHAHRRDPHPTPEPTGRADRCSDRGSLAELRMRGEPGGSCRQLRGSGPGELWSGSEPNTKTNLAAQKSITVRMTSPACMARKASFTSSSLMRRLIMLSRSSLSALQSESSSGMKVRTFELP